MTMKNILSLSISAIILASGLTQIVKGQNRTVLAEAERISGDIFAVSARTSRGAAVYAVSQPSRDVLNSIDKGLNDLFAVARRNGYRKRLSYSDYSVFIGEADRVKDSLNVYSPDIAVSAGQYAGSVYDQGGFVYAAGVVVAFNPCAFLIAEHTKNFERVSNVVRYEGEHLILYHNDRKRYAATADHSKGGGHPILN